MIKTDEKGFTLVEVLVASAIFAFGMLAVLGMLITAMGGNAEGRQITEATNLSASKIEDLKLVPYSNLSSYSDMTSVTNNSVKDTFTRVCNVYTSAAYVPTPLNLKRVAVTTSWTVKGHTHSVTVQTLLTKP